MSKKQIQGPKDNKTTLAKVGFILGIVAIATSLLFIGGLVGIPGIVLSAIGLKTADPKAKKKAKIGLALSVVGIVLAIIAATVGIYFLIKFIFEDWGHPIG